MCSLFKSMLFVSANRTSSLRSRYGYRLRSVIALFYLPLTYTYRCVCVQAASSGSRVLVLTNQKPPSPAGKLFAEDLKATASAAFHLEDTTVLGSSQEDDSDHQENDETELGHSVLDPEL